MRPNRANLLHQSLSRCRTERWSSTVGVQAFLPFCFCSLETQLPTFNTPETTSAAQNWPADCAVLEPAANWTSHPEEHRQPLTNAPKVLAKSATLIVNSSGAKEVYSIGSDNLVWRTTFDPSSASGYIQTNLGLPADSLAVSLDPWGRIVVFAAYGLNLRYIVIDHSPGQIGNKWSKPMDVCVPEVDNATRLGNVYVQTVGDDLHVGVFTQYRVSSTSKLYAFAHALWKRDGLKFQSTPVRMTSMRPIAMGQLRSTPLGGELGFGDSGRVAGSSFW